jgi:hypothetical protein
VADPFRPTAELRKLLELQVVYVRRHWRELARNQERRPARFQIQLRPSQRGGRRLRRRVVPRLTRRSQGREGRGRDGRAVRR